MCTMHGLHFLVHMHAISCFLLQGEAMELLEETSGALLDIEPILGRDVSKIDTLIKYIHEETTRNSQCR